MNHSIHVGFKAALFGLALVAIPMASPAGAQESDKAVRVAQLSGNEEVPPVGTSASGVGTVLIEKSEGNITFSVLVSDLSNIVGAHIHAGSPGSIGPILFTLSSGSFDELVSGVVDDTDFTPLPEAGILTFEDALSAIENGNTYINVHTQANPDGEIRGQLRNVFQQPGATPSPSVTPTAFPCIPDDSDPSECDRGGNRGPNGNGGNSGPG